MANITLTVTDFTFPADLKDDFAAFRLSVTLRYMDPDDKLVDVMEVIPGAGNKDYWECEKANQKDPKKNPVRHPTLPKIDTTKVDVSRREALFAGLKFKSLDRVTVKIYDIEKDGKWDKILNKSLKIAFGVGLELLSAGTAITVGNVLTLIKKSKAADRSEVEKQFDDIIDASTKAGRSRLLWEHSADIEGITSGDHFAVTGNSALGIFTVDFASLIK
ncbi:MAG TPA: hypothetical protein VGC66_00280 [Pyrinomonadaceae bacterium]|jgi:hypothetical protein